MKKVFLALVLFAGLSLAHAQDTIARTAIDEYVSAEIPGVLVEYDTLIESLPLRQYSSTVNTSVFALQKIKLDSKENRLNSLPSDDESLNQWYKELVKSYMQGITQTDADTRLLDTTAIKIGKYKGLLLKCKKGKAKVLEAKMLVLGEYVYFFSYANYYDFNENEKNAFLNSIVVSDNNPGQFAGESSGYKRGFAIGTVVGVLIIMGLLAGFIYLIVYLVRKSRR